MKLSDGIPFPVAGVRIAAYPLTALEPLLAPKIADAQAARARLDPQIDQAFANLATKTADEKAAADALRGAGPSNPLRRSLVFASDAARKARRTAEGDLKYLTDERGESAAGPVFFQGLPEPAVTADTDTQGRFTLTLPPDGGTPYAVVATARRTGIDGSVRQLYWIVKLSSAQRTGRDTLRLDNANSSASSAAESMIRTVD